MVETIGRSSDDSRFGITTVQPNRAIKKCRIRNLRIEYILSDAAVILTLPKSCGNCKCIEYCTDDFILQIIEKSYRNKQDKKRHFFLP